MISKTHCTCIAVVAGAPLPLLCTQSVVAQESGSPIDKATVRTNTLIRIAGNATSSCIAHRLGNRLQCGQRTRSTVITGFGEHPPVCVRVPLRVRVRVRVDVPDHVRVGVPDRLHVRVRVRIPGYPWLAVAILGYPYGRMSDTVSYRF